MCVSLICPGVAPPDHYPDACATHKGLPLCWHVDVHGTRSRSIEVIGTGRVDHFSVDWMVFTRLVE